MRVCEITGGIVTKIVDLPDSYTIDLDRASARGIAICVVSGDEEVEELEYEGVYEAPVGALLAVSSEAEPGWSWTEAGGFIAPAPIAPTQAELIQHARDLRWQMETAGILFNGVAVATDDRSKLMLSGARQKAATDPDFETTWFGPDPEDTGTVLTAALIIAISDAVLAHVDACFATYGQVVSAIGSGAVTTRDQIDEAFA
ncbi:DUF4376 domain-containing protein [Bosea sp. ANAM02]|uniref:DUF4376 domain-containing protein n=1 Tax=Bosea sp. ANAM02 TaxID=2020412 RepID=UPI00140EE352|nr:DUF4376 domain-containing protein [Bosea sp. ANAM02]BCB18062.1 hypothetical protein OCUBac02_09560 [Bosea sp. ANAM02]